VNSDEKPLCSLSMYSGEGTCGKQNNVWVSDGVTQGAKSCVCLLLYCELGESTWSATTNQFCYLRVKLKFEDPQTLPDTPISYFGLPLWDTFTFLFTTLELYLLVFPIYRLIRWLLSLGDFMKDWGRY